MQGIPEIVCSLVLENHAIYQIVRLAKVTFNMSENESAIISKNPQEKS
jgi:hypothetical protein